MKRTCSVARRSVAACLTALGLSACRATFPLESYELDGATLLGMRKQAGWESSTVPLMRVDGSARPLSWPVAVQASCSLSGYFGDDQGEQSLDLGLGLVRRFEIVPDAVFGSLGAGRLFVTTDNGELFASQSDDWQANYVETGLYLAVGSGDETSVGIEARYSTGDGPRLGATQLDGDFLDLYLIVRFGPGAR